MLAFIRLKRSFSSIFLIASYFLIASLSHAADPIGVLSVVIGSVSIEREGALIEAESKAKVFEDDVIVTGGKSRAQVLLLDQTAINISQNAELQLDKFVFGTDDDAVSLKVTKGTFRFISGKVATKTPEKVNVETPVATIGVRGTEFIGQIGAAESVIALFNGKIEVANDSYTQQVGVPGFGVTIDPVGLISAPVKLPQEQLSALVDAVSTRKEVLDNETADQPESRKEDEEEEEGDEEEGDEEEGDEEEGDEEEGDEEEGDEEEGDEEESEEEGGDEEESEEEGGDEEESEEEESEEEGGDEEESGGDEEESGGDESEGDDSSGDDGEGDDSGGDDSGGDDSGGDDGGSSGGDDGGSSGGDDGGSSGGDDGGSSGGDDGGSSGGGDGGSSGGGDGGSSGGGDGGGAPAPTIDDSGGSSSDGGGAPAPAIGDSGGSSSVGGGDIFSANAGGDGPVASASPSVAAPSPATFSSGLSAMSAPEVTVEAPIIQSVFVEVDTSAVISDKLQAQVAANVLNFTNETTLTSLENVIIPVDFGTNNPSTYRLGASNALDNGLFTINSLTGELFFINPPDFEQPSDFDTNNTYQVEVFASDSLVTISDIFSIQITNQQVLSATLFDSSRGIVNSSFKSQLVDFSDWSDLTSIGDGWQTFATTPDLTFSATGLNISGVDQDIFLDKLKLVYNLRKDTIDVTAVGNMVVSSQGIQIRNNLNTNNFVDYSLNYTNRSAAEFLAAGFAPGHWLFATQSGMTGLLPDADDIISIVDGDGVDRSSEVAMTLEIAMQNSADGGLFTTVATVAQSGTNSSSERITATEVSVALGAPLIEENENLGGDSFVTASSFEFTNTTSVTITENVKDALTLGSTRPDTVNYSLIANNASNDNDLFIIDAQTGLVSFLSAPDHENHLDFNNDGIYTVDLTATDQRSGEVINQNLLITVSDLSTLQDSAYSSSEEQITDVANFNALHTAHTSWEQFTGAGGVDGWYTFATGADLTYTAQGLQISGINQDIYVDGLKVVYNARTQLIDVTAVGNMTAISNGARVTDTSGGAFLVDFSLSFTNRSVTEAEAAGFSPNNWLFATSNDFGNALLPDDDDVISITDLDGVDRTSDISMFLSFGTSVNNNTGLFVSQATVGQSGTGSDGLRLATTDVSFTLGTPLIQEDENLGGDSLISSNQGTFSFTNTAAIAMEESSSSVTTLSSNFSDVLFTLDSDSSIENSNDLFTLDNQTGELIFTTPLDIANNNDGTHTVVVDALHSRAGVIQQILSITVTDIGNGNSLLASDFSTAEGLLPSSTKAALAELATWQQFNYLAHSGIYTFVMDQSRIINGPSQHGRSTDLLLYNQGFKLTYDAKNALVDAAVRGDMILPVAGVTDFIFFDLQFTNHPVSEFQNAGFTPGKFVFATSDNGTFEGILPDYDDIVKITTASNGGGADVSDKVSMQVQAQILENANTSKYTAVGNVSYKTTNENLQFSDVATQIEVELGTPTITEN